MTCFCTNMTSWMQVFYSTVSDPALSLPHQTSKILSLHIYLKFSPLKKQVTINMQICWSCKVIYLISLIQGLPQLPLKIYMSWKFVKIIIQTNLCLQIVRPTAYQTCLYAFHKYVSTIYVNLYCEWPQVLLYWQYIAIVVQEPFTKLLWCIHV